MNSHPLSIRTILLLTITALTLLIAVSAAQEVYVQWQRLAKIEALKDAARVSDQLFDTDEKLSIERDIAVTLLRTSDAETIANLQPRLLDSRAQTDNALHATLEALAHYNFPELSVLQDQITVHLSNIRTLRQQIDEAIKRDTPQQRSKLANQWYSDVTELTQQTDDLWLGFVKHFTDIDPVVTQHLHYKHFLRIMTDTMAKERAIISRLIAENTDPSPEEFAQLLRGQGVIDLDWQTIFILANQSGLYPTISPYYRDARSYYATLYDMVHNIFYLPNAKHGAAYPISADIWLELSTEVAESLDDLKTASLKETQRYVATLEDKAQQAIVIHILFLLFALVLCVYSFHLITNRVVRPINHMIEALLATIRGKPISFAPSTGHQLDEIKKLSEVLTAFQRKAEDSILLAAIVASSEDAIISKTLDGKILSWNKGAEHLFGYSAAEAIGQHISLIIPPEKMEEERHIIAQVRQGKSVEHFETIRMDRQGRRIDISLAISPLHDASGAIIGASKTARDITARKQAEQEIRENQNRYRALIEASAQVIWTWKEGALDKTSPLAQWWETTTGQPSEDIATFGWLETVHPDDRDRVQKIWADAIVQGKNFDMEYRLRARDGRYLHVAIRGVALFAPDGSLHEFIGSLNDITPRKQAEEQLQRYTHDLERSNQELDDFAYIASHDLKEPLRGLFNHASFLLEDYSKKLDEDGVRRLNRLAQLSQRMEHLVNDLLYFSRLGRAEMAMQETDVNTIITDIEQMTESFLHERHARIVVPQSLPVIVCDRTRITEVFRNLITNAVKYNDKPECIVEVGFLDKVKTPQGTENSVFYVKDNGIGIEAGFYQEIFRIFKRLQRSATGKEDGTGVGLTFVKKIIERHKGRIWLESEPGRGTVFYFTTGGKDHE